MNLQRSTFLFSPSHKHSFMSHLSHRNKMFAMILDRNDALSHNKRHNSCFEFKQRTLCFSIWTLVVLFFFLYIHITTCFSAVKTYVNIFDKPLVTESWRFGCDSLDKNSHGSDILLIVSFKITHKSSPVHLQGNVPFFRRFLSGMEGSQLCFEENRDRVQVHTDARQNTHTENKKPRGMHD